MRHIEVRLMMLVGLVICAMLFMMIVPDLINPDDLASEYAKFQECIEMEYERDFCLALVD